MNCSGEPTNQPANSLIWSSLGAARMGAPSSVGNHKQLTTRRATVQWVLPVLWPVTASGPGSVKPPDSLLCYRQLHPRPSRILARTVGFHVPMPARIP
jgi:hypothetical protein